MTGHVNVSDPPGGMQRPATAPMRCEIEPPLHIAPHVFVCVTGDGSVLLDLKRDKYLGLGRDETEWIAFAVEAWPKPIWDYPNKPQAGDDQVALRRLLALLIDAEVLSRDEESVSAGRRSVVNMRVDWISIGDELEVDSRVTAGHAISFLKSYAEARASLAMRPFARTVERVRTRKAARGGEHRVCPALRVAKMVDAFRRLRPFVFAPEGRCLLHALTLVNFLARYDFYPEWVLGVSTRPWGAHSWVQWGNYLLDTNPEKVCAFTPILVV
jgi:Transglutaminase-like superfamily